MKKFFNKQSVLIIVAIVLGLLLNRTNCVSDPYCDPDPLYGGCSSSCDFGTTTQWLIKSLGIWFLLNFGSFLGKENLKKEENLKEFLDHEGLKHTVRQINDKWIVEDQKSEEEVNRLISLMDSQKKTTDKK